MRLKRLRIFSYGVILSVGSLLALAAPQLVHAAGNNCLWTGATDTNFSTTTNWTNCGGVAPGAGDSLIFDNTSIGSTGSILTDDITATTFANITFQGTGSNAYEIIEGSPNTLSLSGDITDSTTSGSQIDLPITFTGASPTVTVSNANGDIEFGDGSTAYAMNTGANNVTFTGSGQVSNYEPITGSGTLTINTNNDYVNYVANPSFTGSVILQSGVLLYDSSDSSFPDMFSASSGLQIQSGSSLEISDPDATTATISEPITAIGGTGFGQCTYTGSSSTIDCGAIFASLGINSNLTLAGPITLTGNSQFNSNDTITITGALSGSFTIQNIVGDLVVDASSNSSLTPNGTYSGTGNAVNASGGGSTSSSSSTASTPKTPGKPDTGSSLIQAPVLLSLLGAIAMASSIYVVSKFNLLSSKSK